MESVSDYKAELCFLKNHFLNWKDVPESIITFQRLNSLVNIIYKVTADADVTPKRIVLRKLAKTESEAAKDPKSKIIEAVIEAELGPKRYAKNSDYLCEEYLDTDLISNSQINEPFWRRKLAAVIAKHHTLSISGPKWPNFMFGRISTDLLEVVDTKLALEGFTQEQRTMLSELKRFGSQEERELSKTFVPTENLVISHNDTHRGNIFVTKPDGRIVFIDYEFCDYSNRAYDGAYLFSSSIVDFEYSKPPYFKIDSNMFPTFENVTDFATYYLYAASLTRKEIEELEKDDLRLKDNAWLLEKVKRELNVEAFERELKTYIEEFQKCLLECQYDAILWGTRMCDPKQEGFDFLVYAYERSKLYLKWRERFLKGDTIFDRK